MNIPDHDWRLEAPYQYECADRDKFEGWLEEFREELMELYEERFPDEEFVEEEFMEWAWGQWQKEMGL